MDRLKIRERIRAKIQGTSDAPRLAVFKSSKHIYAQLIDDEKGVTIAAARDEEAKDKKKAAKAESARLVGAEIAKKAAAKGIKKAVFDRGGFQYHGRISAVAEGARDGGLKL